MLTLLIRHSYTSFDNSTTDGARRAVLGAGATLRGPALQLAPLRHHNGVGFTSSVWRFPVTRCKFGRSLLLLDSSWRLDDPFKILQIIYDSYNNDACPPPSPSQQCELPLQSILKSPSASRQHPRPPASTLLLTTNCMEPNKYQEQPPKTLTLKP